MKAKGAGENVRSTLGRAVLIIWLFVVLIITSSYTASLSSILTVQQLQPTIQGISGLIESSVPIGYQAGSFVEDYLLQLNVPIERLVPLNTLASFAAALNKGPKDGGVGAIVDELPYIQLLLSSECEFTIAGQEFTKGGWGFAFRKGSQLALDMSTAILTLAENGELQRIHDSWLRDSDCSGQNMQINSNQLGFNTFWGLFLITGGASIFCCVFYHIRMILQYHRRAKDRPVLTQSSSRLSKGASIVKSFVSFVSEPEESASPHPSSKRQDQQESTVRNSFAECAVIHDMPDCVSPTLEAFNLDPPSR